MLESYSRVSLIYFKTLFSIMTACSFSVYIKISSSNYSQIQKITYYE